MPKLALFILLSCAAILELVESGGHEHGHRHVIIHVPYKIKTIKHTHTITKHIHHKDEGDKYEVLGYTVGKPIDLGHDLGGHGGHDFGGHDFGGHDWSGGGGGGGGGGHDWSGGGIGGGGGGHDWSGGGIGEGLKGYEGSFDGGHMGGYEASEGGAELGGHEFSGGYGVHEEYGGH